MNSRIQVGWSGQARAETICPSITAPLSTNSARAWPDHPTWMREFIEILRSKSPA